MAREQAEAAGKGEGRPPVNHRITLSEAIALGIPETTLDRALAYHHHYYFPDRNEAWWDWTELLMILALLEMKDDRARREGPAS
jgi:hypothetical protein